MKKHAEYVPFELSDAELENFVAKLRDRLFAEFWSDFNGNPEEAKIKARIEGNIYAAFEAILK